MESARQEVVVCEMGTGRKIRALDCTNRLSKRELTERPFQRRLSHREVLDLARNTGRATRNCRNRTDRVIYLLPNKREDGARVSLVLGRCGGDRLTDAYVI